MVNFRKLENYDDVEKIATWIYSTDEFTFNIVFKNKTNAIKALKKLILSDYINPYHRQFINICYSDKIEEIQGIAVSFKGSDISVKNMYKAMKSTSYTNLPLIIIYLVICRFFASRIASDDYYLGNLFVNPEHRHKGIGSKLVNKCKELAIESNSNALLLDVEYDKEYLLDFYDKIGLKQESKNYHKIFGKTYGCYGLKYNLK
ncbi:GNAT family N-acetyltransferase [Methanosphaera sp.]